MNRDDVRLDIMNSRERVLSTINHVEPDRVPIDFGGNQTSIHVKAYNKLLEYTGIRDDHVQLVDFAEQAALPCEELLQRFESDTRYVRPPGSLVPADVVPETNGRYVGRFDQFGVFWGYDAGTNVEDILYYDPVGHPLADMTTQRQIHEYDWPDGKDTASLAGLDGVARELRGTTSYALVTPVIGCVFEYTTFLFGFKQALKHVVKNPALIAAAMEELVTYWIDRAGTFLDMAGGCVDVACINGDLAQQSGPIVNPRYYADAIVPFEKRLSDFIHHHYNVKINYHSCGSTSEFIPHFVHLGYDAHNPVQVSAHDMEPCSLKKRFGGKITFWGGACDTQNVLPFGTPEQIRAHVKQNMNCFKPGGGYIAANVHNITAEVPPENVVAMFDAIKEFRDYGTRGGT